MKCELEGCDNDARHRVHGWYCSSRHEQAGLQNAIRAVEALRDGEPFPDKRTATEVNRAARWTPTTMQERIRELHENALRQL